MDGLPIDYSVVQPLHRLPSTTCSGMNCTFIPPTPFFGSDELGRMMAICHERKSRSAVTMNPPPRIPAFEPGWEACVKIWAAWLDSEEARRQKAAAEQAERLRQEVIDFERNLKR